MNKLSSFLIAFAIVGLFPIFFGLFHDFVVNAEWKSDELEPYGEFGEGVWLAEARTDVNSDVLHIISSNLKNNKWKAAAYYRHAETLFSLIKYNKGEEWTIPHELAHHFFYTKMNESERESWCNTFNWTNWSYDESCEEGFAEFFGYSVISNAPLVEILEYNLTDGVTKWKCKKDDCQTNLPN